MLILVINSGSSSLKYQLMDNGNIIAKGIAERIGMRSSFIKHQRTGCESVVIDYDMPEHGAAIREVLAILTGAEHGVLKSMDEIRAVGHRVLHGGEKFAGSYLVTPEVIEAIRDCIPLGPLHNPANLAGIEACQKAMPGTPQVAVFDTAFHQTMPPEAYMYAVPYEYYRNYGVRRYGFHGTSHQFVAERAAVMLGRPFDELKIITCHLGNGSSIAAVKNGKCYDTSMGMTPLAGVPMGTRSGDIDPAIIKYLMDCDPELTIENVDFILNKKSGVLGISGVSSDFRDLCAEAEKGNERARLALSMFGYSCRKYIGAYAAALGGVDAVVFTAGIGENTPTVRSQSVRNLAFMGIEIDEKKNAEVPRGAEMDVSLERSAARILVIPTNEELAIANETQRISENLK